MNGTPTAGQPGDVSTEAIGDAAVGDLLARLTEQMSTLVAQELRLAQAEARATVRQAAEGSGMIAAAGVAGGIGALLLSLAACKAVSRILPDPLAYGLVGGAFMAASGALGLAGATELADLDLLPRTRGSLEETGRRVSARLRVGWESRPTAG
jgi:uncharacterized membrane protein